MKIRKRLEIAYSRILIMHLILSFMFWLSANAQQITESEIKNIETNIKNASPGLNYFAIVRYDLNLYKRSRGREEIRKQAESISSALRSKSDVDRIEQSLLSGDAALLDRHIDIQMIVYGNYIAFIQKIADTGADIPFDDCLIIYNYGTSDWLTCHICPMDKSITIRNGIACVMPEFLEGADLSPVGAASLMGCLGDKEKIAKGEMVFSKTRAEESMREKPEDGNWRLDKINREQEGFSLEIFPPQVIDYSKIILKFDGSGKEYKGEEWIKKNGSKKITKVEGIRNINSNGKRFPENYELTEFSISGDLVERKRYKLKLLCQDIPFSVSELPEGFETWGIDAFIINNYDIYKMIKYYIDKGYYLTDINNLGVTVLGLDPEFVKSADRPVSR